jgi:hypothetical protein
VHNRNSKAARSQASLYRPSDDLIVIHDEYQVIILNLSHLD